MPKYILLFESKKSRTQVEYLTFLLQISPPFISLFGACAFISRQAWSNHYPLHKEL